MTRTTAVLLAAGAGTRLGRGPKALLPFGDATLLHHAVEVLLQGGCHNVIIVIGSGAPSVRATPLPARCHFVVNPRWNEGMSTSLAVGIAAAHQERADAEAEAERRAWVNSDNILVALVDQPGMSAQLVARLLAEHRPGRITAAGYREFTAFGAPKPSSHLQRGNPVLFSSEHATLAAATATGDTGARGYLSFHPDAVDVVDCSDLADGADVDTPNDLHLLAEPR